MTQDVPCMGCGERSAGCHSKCCRYKEFKRQHDAEAERCRRRQAPDAVRMVENARTERIIKNRRQ